MDRFTFPSLLCNLRSWATPKSQYVTEWQARGGVTSPANQFDVILCRVVPASPPSHSYKPDLTIGHDPLSLSLSLTSFSSLLISDYLIFAFEIINSNFIQSEW